MITGELGQIYPKEASDGSMDPRKQQIGTGGFMLDKYTPSSKLVYKRNPDYWNKDAVYTDVLDIPFISDPAQRLAQFKTGGVYAVPVANRHRGREHPSHQEGRAGAQHVRISSRRTTTSASSSAWAG